MADYAPLKKRGMSAQVIDGKAVAAGVRERVAREVGELGGRGHGSPGSRRSSSATTRRRRSTCARSARRARRSASRSIHHELAAATLGQDELAALIETLNADRRCTASCSSCRCPPQIDQDAMTGADRPAQGRRRPDAGQRRACCPGPARRSCRARRRGDGAARARRRRARGRRAPWWSAARSSSASRSPSCCSPQNATVTHCHSRTRDLAGGLPRGRRARRRGRRAAAP